MTRFHLSIVIFCSIIFLGGCSHQANPKDVTNRLSVDEAREVAIQYIKDRRATTDGWEEKWAIEDPMLGEGVPLFATRDDVPDFFLFVPTCSDGLPCGYIVIRVTDKVPSISELSEREEASFQQTLSDSKLYVLSPFHWYRVPNDATAGTLVDTTVPHLTMTFEQFKETLSNWRE